MQYGLGFVWLCFAIMGLGAFVWGVSVLVDAYRARTDVLARASQERTQALHRVAHALIQCAVRLTPCDAKALSATDAEAGGGFR